MANIPVTTKLITKNITIAPINFSNNGEFLSNKSGSDIINSYHMANNSSISMENKAL